MKRALAICSFLLIGFNIASLHAAEKNTFYIGGAIGGLKNDFNASLFVTDPNDVGNQGETGGYKERSPSAVNVTLIAGFHIFPWLAAELQYGSTETQNLLGGNLELATETLGLFGVYQAGDELFAKVRLGLAQRDLEFTTAPAFGNQNALTGAIGFSVGQDLPVGTFELMYMYYPKMKIESKELKEITDPVGEGEGIKFSDRVDTNTWSIAYTYTF